MATATEPLSPCQVTVLGSTNGKDTRPHSTPRTLKWLNDNYTLSPGVCIPRNTLYIHYMDYCRKTGTQPVNAASFGKIIRQQFPKITTRRLGTRGQSKYHYYGIAVKQTSQYFDVLYSPKCNNGLIDCRKENSKNSQTKASLNCPKASVTDLITDFPDIKDIKLPPEIPEDKVMTFLLMYRTHCQRILDTIIRASFDDVQTFLVHFWQGMPQHIIPILETKTLVAIVGVCDLKLYKAIIQTLVPSILQPLPDSLARAIQHFSKSFEEWLRMAIGGMPDNLQILKFDIASRFSNALKLQITLADVCQANRTFVQKSDKTYQMLCDWNRVDMHVVIKQTLQMKAKYSERDHYIISHLCMEFKKLLEDQATIDIYMDWLEHLVYKCVQKPCSNKPRFLKKVANQFLLMWYSFGTCLVRDLTLQSSQSFGSFHLVRLMFDDYVAYLVGSLISDQREDNLMKMLRGDIDADSDAEDELLNHLYSKTAQELFEKSIIGQNGIPVRSSVIRNLKELITENDFKGTGGMLAVDRDSGVESNYSFGCEKQISVSDLSSTSETTTSQDSNIQSSPSSQGEEYFSVNCLHGENTLQITDASGDNKSDFGFSSGHQQYLTGSSNYSWCGGGGAFLPYQNDMKFESTSSRNYSYPGGYTNASGTTYLEQCNGSSPFNSHGYDWRVQANSQGFLNIDYIQNEEGLDGGDAQQKFPRYDYTTFEFTDT